MASELDKLFFAPELLDNGVKASTDVEQDFDHPLSKGLVGRWLFNEGAGDTVFDISGNNHGNLVNSPTREIDTDLSHAVRFDGSNQHGYIGSMLDAPSEFTLEVWIKPNATQINKGLIGKWSTTGYMLWISVAQKLSLAIDSSPHIEGITTISSGTLYHGVGTYDGATSRLYVNGVEEASQSESGPSSTGASFYLARYGSAYFNGKIGLASAWDRALSAEEVLDRYENPYKDLIPRSYFLPARVPAAGGFQAAWARQRSGMIGAR